MNPVKWTLLLAMLWTLPLFSFDYSRDRRPKFKKQQISVANKKITVEIADSELKRGYGLMFVEKMPQDEGMLFIFEQPEVQSFWMKNTLIPLSIGYFDKNLKLIIALELQRESLVLKTLPGYSSKEPALYALEMNKNWFTDNGIKPGAKLNLKP